MPLSVSPERNADLASDLFLDKLSIPSRQTTSDGATMMLVVAHKRVATTRLARPSAAQASPWIVPWPEQRHAVIPIQLAIVIPPLHDTVLMTDH
jgi:hypothetical protein